MLRRVFLEEADDAKSVSIRPSSSFYLASSTYGRAHEYLYLWITGRLLHHFRCEMLSNVQLTTPACYILHSASTDMPIYLHNLASVSLLVYSNTCLACHTKAVIQNLLHILFAARLVSLPFWLNKTGHCIGYSANNEMSYGENTPPCL